MATCNELSSCPGMFCGRLNVSNLTNICYSACMACPQGYRTSGNGSNSLCLPCDTPADARDYLYLIFMCLIVLFVRLGIVTMTNWYRLRSPFIIVQYIVPVIEVSLALILTLLSLPPQGYIHFNACHVNTVSDFYPILFNPKVDYVHELRCTSEVIYPLYSMIFIFLGIYFALHLPFLSFVLIYSYYSWSHNKRDYFSSTTEYVWLLTYPIVFIVHGIFAGLIYYSFDFITIILTVGAYAVLSTALHIYKFEYFKNTFKVYTLGVQWLLVIGCMLLLGCGILSLTKWADLKTRSYFLPLILLPPLFHPILSMFASPKHLFQAWSGKSFSDIFDH